MYFAKDEEREGERRGRSIAPRHYCQVLLPLHSHITDKPFHATFTILFYFERYIFLDFIAVPPESAGEKRGGRRGRENARPTDRPTDVSRILFMFNDFHRDTEIHVIMS